MKMEAKNQITLSWKTKFGLFQTILWDNKITNMSFLKEGSSMSSPGLRMYEHDVGFLREVHKALGETINYVENNEKI